MAAELYSPYLGVTEANISQLFQRARANLPALLFIDEIGNIQFSRIKFCIINSYIVTFIYISVTKCTSFSLVILIHSV